MKIVFVDKNKSLVKKVQKAIKFLPKEFKVEAKEGDIFQQEGVIVSASNPQFSMGGGLDALIAEKYPKECSIAQATSKPAKMIRVGNIIFTITVGNDFKATRELVGEALKFALTNTSSKETVLISGLGTGIGSLEEDDFVWLFLAAICKHYGYRWGIKFTNKKGDSFSTNRETGETVHYEVGKIVQVKDAPKNGEECGHGLHLGKSFIGAGNYAVPEKVFLCAFKRDHVCGEGNDKVRVSKMKVLAELPLWLGFGTKSIYEKLNKKFNAEDYNPYQATKLPTKKQILATKLRAQVWDQVRAQVVTQVWDQVRDQVGTQVWAQVWDQVGDQVGAQVGTQVWDQVRDQVWDQVRDRVWDQVGDQVWATSYWAVNIHFELGVSHWFGGFLNLGVMPIFVKGKVKFFGKKGKYLGEYDQKELFDETL